MRRAQSLKADGRSRTGSRARAAEPRFLVGRDRRGNWVVQDREGRCGGFFVNRAEAIRFATHEDGAGVRAAMMVPGYLEFSVGRPPAADLPAGVARGARHA